ncbi:MAG: bifunctional 23S rRNA (guanine(2069)-N(7))-methyltransferase RlmK/23S rRNA (guanine(2445)-N(2))-methyltransferase RlmL [Gammaproteobacteria bacterium]|nr:bifunctional 23S rRNA (guanine(2069)-N(7))-methyltransferase RlmK/23S rRNA (guanine(2445)-N(2))-methyltransferase RlmL [Gammaproteobacteria bacterium]
MSTAAPAGPAGSASRCVATVPRGLADLLVDELRALGIADARERGAHVQFGGGLPAAYRACLHSRVASRVLLEIAQFAAPTTADFYAAACAVDWRAHLGPEGTLACEFTGRHPGITHSQFGALRLKDAICDRLRADTGRRPDIDPARPSLRVHAHANAAQVTLYVDLAGEGLHRRGYRTEAGEAPLRENLAAGMLLRAGWPRLCAAGAPFLDPLCGSGTLVIEAALIAAGMAPGLGREYFGFLGWRGHDAALWARLVGEARAVAAAVRDARPADAAPLRGTDRDAAVLRNAAANAGRAGVADWVRFEALPVGAVRPPDATPGLIVTNPPYGERLGEAATARALHRELGLVLREHFAGWQAAILTGLEGGTRELQLRVKRTHTLWNGPIECRLLRIDLGDAGTRREPAGPGLRAPDAQLATTPGAIMFANRLRKNIERLERQARRAGVSCLRLYDADMPEYAFAIDRYVEADGGAQHLHVQEYAAPASIDAAAVRRRRGEMLAALPAAAGVPTQRIHLRTRRRQRGSAQYQKLAETGATCVVEEGGCRFEVNFSDYLDTGLFLDHRITRARLAAAAAGRRFLNLFCYTASASVYAARGGARSTLSLDMSNTYLEWAQRNFRLNGLDPARHRLERVDCLAWLAATAQSASPAVAALPGTGCPQFDLIFLDPPTFSRGKRMQGVLDVQRDHALLIEQCMRLLAADGLLVFSSNAQRFRLDQAVAQRWRVADVSAATLPFDFERNARIHRCYELRHQGAHP